MKAFPAPLTLLAVLLLASARPLYAQRWSLCPAEPAAALQPAAMAPGQVEASADRLETTAEGVSLLSGAVVLRQDRQLLQAERIELDRRAASARASGQVRYATPAYELRGDDATLDLEGDQARLDGASYRVPELHAQGRSRRAERTGAEVVVLSDASYSTCPPGEEAWALHAGHLELDRGSEIGTARNLYLDLFGVPVFWSPWFSFPIGERRKSGFLVPSLGSSSRNGVEITLPWYWNAAPNFDATFAPRNLSRRGLQLQNEFRYLNRQGDWQLNADLLQEDRQTGTDRYNWRLQHRGALGRRWRTAVDAAGASDEDYFDDLGTSLTDTSVTHLRRFGRLSYAGGWFDANLMAESWQTLDSELAPSARPYRRLPQFTLATRLPPGRRGLQAGLRAEAVRFDREDSDTGSRLDLTPRLSLAAGGNYWFVEPSLALRHTEYRLDRVSAGPEEISRSLPVASLDAGLFFERPAGSGGSYLQTLEPRLYYLRVPFEEQGEIPLFDTAELDFGFAQLFRENRFSGADRVGDTEQMTLALSSRLLQDADGREVASAALGQIHYLRDRRVGLGTSSPPATARRSDLVGEVGASPWPHWRGSGQLQYDPDADRNSRGVLRLQYQRDNSHIANLAYRYRRAEQEQVDVSARWALGVRWHLIGRWNYSLREDQILENLAGFEYESCCWALRLVSRRFLVDDGNDSDRVIYAQLTLKGFSDIGRDVGGLLEGGILGYRDDLQ